MSSISDACRASWLPPGAIVVGRISSIRGRYCQFKILSAFGLSRRRLPPREPPVEGVVFRGHVDEQLCRREAITAGLFQTLAQLDEGLRAHHVDIGQRTAGERREAEAENRADIGLAHVGDDALLDAARGLERLDGEQTLLEHRNVDLRGVELVRWQIGQAWP